MAVETNVQLDVGTTDVPAVYVNKFQMAVSPNGFVRVACGEAFGDLTRYRLAFVMSVEDAVQLAEAINVTLEASKKPAAATSDKNA